MTRVRGGQWGSRVLQGGRAPKGNRVPLEFQGPKACQASRETRVPQGRLGPAVEWATRGWLASQEKKARRASRANQDPRDSKESAENLATPAPAEMRAPRGCRATRGPRALEDWLETEACPVSPGGRAWRAEMPVTSTSRTWF